MLGITGCGDGSTTTTAVTPIKAPVKQTLSIAWADWAPAKALGEMAQEWGKANNVDIKMDLSPSWSEFPGRVFADFAAKKATYDIIVGDSQWIGKGATEGHYLELTDWIRKELPVDEIEPAALQAFCEYPTGSAKYFAAPCEIDACGFAYRKDLFEDEKEKEAFKAKYKRELAPPKTWLELRNIAEFFTRPQEKLYGLSLFTDSGGYDAVTMGFQQVMWAWGASYCDPITFKVDGVLNSKEGVDALQFYVDLCKFVPPGATNTYHKESIEAMNSGTVAMAMNYYGLMPALVDPKTNKYAEKTGFFPVPAGPTGKAYVSLGGQGMSIMKYSSPDKQMLAKKFIKWFQQTANQKKWASYAGCFTANRKVMQDPAFLKAAPFNPAFRDSLELLRDFYNIPEFNELLIPCQKYWNAALTGKMTAKEAMDAVAKEHTEILKKAGAQQ
jgi:multiple sugar transport system substrate-binding protein